MNIFKKIFRRSKSADPSFPMEAMTKILGFRPHHPEVYKLSLIARSACAVDKNGRRIDNERLEYLGDAVLETIVSEMLYNRFQKMTEGEMTTLRSQLVKREMLNKIGVKIGLGQFVKGKKAENCHNIYGNAVEALVGAVFLDRGYNGCKQFVENRLFGNIDLEKLAHHQENFKSQLMEWGQKTRRNVEFEVFDRDPLPPNTQQFLAKVNINGAEYGQAVDTSKRRAEQAAARRAINRLKQEHDFSFSKRIKTKE